jgi:hypothetical protein
MQSKALKVVRRERERERERKKERKRERLASSLRLTSSKGQASIRGLEIRAVIGDSLDNSRKR